MIQSYILNYLNKAKYEMIDNGKSFYAEIKDLRGVWATGKTLEECRNNIPNFKVPSMKMNVRTDYA